MSKKIDVIPAKEVINFEQVILATEQDGKFMQNTYARSQKWLTGDEVCHILGISKRTCQSYRDKRILPFYQVGRKIYFKITDVDDFLERHHIRADYQRGGAA